eukprot:CAMPEP_0179459004 /NCGR_PEP_ID=MMETSP0799-20121207/42415_1 /TAXON_ID=46947 /ORGANISM="Geminigera cryophila, Strain CCMP2564" /LENGTH=189 /DNA_ID=CAMNT_0021260543 /DNA_START=85 /DNA_END=654 /DNA_ORIENTATION=+
MRKAVVFVVYLCTGSAAFMAPVLPGLPGLRRANSMQKHCTTQLKMGLFDAFKNALSNEDLGTPPPDGLSSDPWLNGMRKSITVTFMKDGSVVGAADALPGDKMLDIAIKAKVTLPATCTMKANDADVQMSAASRIPAPSRRNLVSDSGADDGDAEMMESGLSAPVWTNLSQRGEVRTVTVRKTEYIVYI